MPPYDHKKTSLSLDVSHGFKDAIFQGVLNSTVSKIRYSNHACPQFDIPTYQHNSYMYIGAAMHQLSNLIPTHHTCLIMALPWCHGTVACSFDGVCTHRITNRAICVYSSLSDRAQDPRVEQKWSFKIKHKLVSPEQNSLGKKRLWSIVKYHTHVFPWHPNWNKVCNVLCTCHHICM